MEKEKIVYNEVIKFMTDNGVSCEDAIYQTDRVIENAYEFLGKLYNLVEADLPKDED